MREYLQNQFALLLSSNQLKSLTRHAVCIKQLYSEKRGAALDNLDRLHAEHSTWYVTFLRASLSSLSNFSKHLCLLLVHFECWAMLTISFPVWNRLNNIFKDSRKRLRMEDSAAPIEEESPKSRSKKSNTKDPSVRPLIEHNGNSAKPTSNGTTIGNAEPPVLQNTVSPAQQPAKEVDAPAENGETEGKSPTAAQIPPAANSILPQAPADELQPLLDAAKKKTEAMTYKALQKELKVCIHSSSCVTYEQCLTFFFCVL